MPKNVNQFALPFYYTPTHTEKLIPIYNSNPPLEISFILPVLYSNYFGHSCLQEIPKP